MPDRVEVPTFISPSRVAADKSLMPSSQWFRRDCFAALAMTIRGLSLRGSRESCLAATLQPR
jgi:hypothetical protein